MPAPAPPTVLLVDDDATTRFLLRRLLQRVSPLVQVLEAPDGEQGLALVAAHCQATETPQSLLVLLDLNMPVLNGLAFLDRYQHLPSACRRATTVVVSTTTLNPYELAQAQAGAAGLLPKPVQAEQLAALLRQHLPTAALLA